MTATGPDAATTLPHHGVYVRLGASAIHGIGVIAIRDIPAGTNIFANDRVEIVWIDAAVLADENLTEAERKLYRDFCIQAGDRIGCPVDFHNLTPGWYCNEPRDGTSANVAVDADLNFFAAKDIKEGEELTVQYADLRNCEPSAKLSRHLPEPEKSSLALD